MALKRRYRCQTAALRARKAEKRDALTYILSGELNAETLPGFCHPTPLALMRQDVTNRFVRYGTTDGTVALRKSSQADAVYAAALINGNAVVEHVTRQHENQTVLIVCSGSADNFNLEFLRCRAPGVAVSTALRRGYELTDAARAACWLYERTDAWESLSQARVGRLMLSRNLGDEIRFAAQTDRFAIAPKLLDGVLRSVKTAAACGHHRLPA